MSTVITPTSPKAFALDVQGLAPESVIPESVLIEATTKVGQVEGDQVYVRVPAINLDADTGFVPEGNDIPEADPDLSELILATGKVAALVKLSREQLSQPNISAVITQEVNRAMQGKVNWAALQQPAPVSPAVYPPAGLMAYAVDGGTIADDLDSVIDAVASIEALGGSATNIIAAPDAWAAIAKLKDETTSNRSLIGAGTESAQRSLLSIPVRVTSAMPTKKILILDKTKTLSAYGALNVAVSDQVYFGSDNIGIRATLRFGVGFSKAGAGVKLSIA